MQICCFHLKYFHLSFLQQRKEEGKGADGVANAFTTNQMAQKWGEFPETKI